MNIRDIARLANVTPGTVSKVLNNYPDISEATRQHVLQIIKENQYTTKNGGRKFKQAVTPRIGLVSENVPSAFTTPTILFYPFRIIIFHKIKMKNFRNY